MNRMVNSLTFVLAPKRREGRALWAHWTYEWRRAKCQEREWHGPRVNGTL